MSITRASCLAKDFKSTFLSCEKDLETIQRKLFIESKPYSDTLKRLLVINTKDCLSDKYQYQEYIDGYRLSDLVDQGYVRTVPKINLSEHDEAKAYLMILFDSFTPSNNPEYRNAVIDIYCVCNSDCWVLDDYKLRPFQIAGYVDGILDGARLSGIGTLQFTGSATFTMNEFLSGVVLHYLATHGSDDSLPPDVQMTGRDPR